MFQRALLRWWKERAQRIDIDYIARLIEENNLPALFDYFTEPALVSGIGKAAQGDKLMAQFGRLEAGGLDSVYMQVFAGGAAAASAGSGAGIMGALSIKDPQTIAFSQYYSGKLITHIGEGTRDALREVLANAQATGQSPYSVARQIRNNRLIDQTPAQCNAYFNYGRSLDAQGVPVDRRQKLLARYADKQLKYRAETIALTESNIAAQAGKNAGYKQAQQLGILDTQVPRRWIVGPDEKVCAKCMQNDGAHAKIGYSFPSGNEMPPAHPRCRCDVRLDYDAVGVNDPTVYNKPFEPSGPEAGRTLEDIPDPDDEIEFRTSYRAPDGLRKPFGDAVLDSKHLNVDEPKLFKLGNFDKDLDRNYSGVLSPEQDPAWRMKRRAVRAMSDNKQIRQVDAHRLVEATYRDPKFGGDKLVARLQQAKASGHYSDYQLLFDPEGQFVKVVDTTRHPGLRPTKHIWGEIDEVEPSLQNFVEYTENGNVTTFARAIQAGTPEAEEALRMSAVNKVIKNWAISSSDESMASTVFQVAVRKFAGLPWESLDHLDPKMIKKAKQIYSEYEKEWDAIVRGMYEETQKQLKAQGITSVPLYRGVTQKVVQRESTEVFDDVDVMMQPVSSFSSSPKTALDFSNPDTLDSAILAGEVPAQDIISMPTTGAGCLHEHEYIVVGGRVTMSARYPRTWLYEWETAEDALNEAPAVNPFVGAPEVLHAPAAIELLPQ